MDLRVKRVLNPVFFRNDIRLFDSYVQCIKKYIAISSRTMHKPVFSLKTFIATQCSKLKEMALDKEYL